MPVKIICKYNDQGAWCKNKNIKRSLFGIGARCCVEFPLFQGKEGKICEYAERKPKPKISPLPTR